MASSQSKRSRQLPAPSDSPPHVDFAAVFEFLAELKPRSQRRAVKAKSDGDASGALAFVCAGGDGEDVLAPCEEFVEWLLCCTLSALSSCGGVGEVDTHVHVLAMLVEHDGVRGVLGSCRLLPPFICLSFRVYFDMLREGTASKAELWLQLLLLFLFKLCNLDDHGPELVLRAFKSSGSEDFAYVVQCLMQVAANNVSCSAASPLLPAADGAGFMSKCAVVVVKGAECAGCLAVDVCSMLCCASPECVSYAILSDALKPSLVMNLTLLVFQRLSSPALQPQHERLALSWLVPPQQPHAVPVCHVSLTPPPGRPGRDRVLRQHRLHRHPCHPLQQERVPARPSRHDAVHLLHAPQPTPR